MDKQERTRKVLLGGKQINIEQKEILTRDEVMVLYDLSPNTLDGWVNSGLHFFQIGGKDYFDHAKVKSFIREGVI